MTNNHTRQEEIIGCAFVNRQRSPSTIADAGSACDKSMMLWKFLLAGLAVSPAASAADFSQSYGIGISLDRGQCVYWLTDVGLDAKQLAESLRNGYDTKRGVEILTSDDTPNKCIMAARRAAVKAGFVAIRARPGTDKDRLPGIP